jgi:predicted lipoprotein with Yx(FWY)xxD motif
MTLYLFTNDSPGVSTCEGGCLDAWPPLLGEPEAGAGANADLLGTIERSDGTTQVTYNDWPLYFWAQDSAPGDATGQGVNEVWWVVSPEGEAIEQV